jgi:hypothetical protein
MYTILHLNENREYKTVKPKKVIETITFYDPSGTKTEKNIKVFDNSGMLLTEERFDENGTLTAKLTYVNDTTKRLILERVLERWNSFGNSKETAYYVYDTDNFLILVEDKNKNGTTINRSEIKNNEKGNPIEFSGFDRNGNFYGKETATYFYDKNKVKISVVSNDGNIVSTDTIKISFKDSFKYKEDKETYNDRGDLTEYSSKNFNGTFTTYKEEYQYDIAGNCIENKIHEVIMKPNGKQKLKLKNDYKMDYFY